MRGYPRLLCSSSPSTPMKMSLMQPALEGMSTWLGLSSPKAGVAISVALAIAARNLFMPPLGIFSLLQSRLHQSARFGDIHSPSIFAAQNANDLAHVLHTGGTSLFHRRFDRRLHFVIRHLLGQIAGDDGNLLLLLLDQIGAAALLVKLDRFLPLLDHLLQEADHLGIAERRLAGTARLNIGILERGIDHA